MQIPGQVSSPSHPRAPSAPYSASSAGSRYRKARDVSARPSPQPRPCPRKTQPADFAAQLPGISGRNSAAKRSSKYKPPALARSSPTPPQYQPRHFPQSQHHRTCPRISSEIPPAPYRRTWRTKLPKFFGLFRLIRSGVGRKHW